jgi:hypothetical protein
MMPFWVRKHRANKVSHGYPPRETRGPAEEIQQTKESTRKRAKEALLGLFKSRRKSKRKDSPQQMLETVVCNFAFSPSFRMP